MTAVVASSGPSEDNATRPPGKQLTVASKPGHRKGEVARARTALLTVVTARSIVLGEHDRAKIEACGDVAALDAWLARAARATTSAEIFAD
jgi:hypothetical protein